MDAVCVICSDLLNCVNPISAAPCGHVYHANCLELINRNSSVCPQCHLRTNLRSVRKLNFTFLPKSEKKSSNLEIEITNLKAQLNAKDVELEACKREKENIIRDTDKIINAMEEYTNNLVNEVTELRLKVELIPAVKKKLLLAKESLMDSMFEIDIACESMDAVIEDLQNALNFP